MKYLVKHFASVQLPGEEIDHWNKLLAIDSLDEMTDDELLKAGANTNQCIGLFAVEFDNGASITVDVCSGNHNYYDNTVLTTPDGYEHVLDCEYEIDDIEIDIDENDTSICDRYIVRIERTR